MSGYKFDCPQYVDFTKPFSGDEADALDDFFGGPPEKSAEVEEPQPGKSEELAGPVTPSNVPIKQDKPTVGRSCRSASLERNHKRRSTGPVTRKHGSMELGRKPRGKLRRSGSLDRRKGSTGTSDNSKQMTAETAYATRLRLTKPTTPSFMKRETKMQFAAPAVSTEQLEMRKIQELRQELARKRKIADESRRKAQAAPGPMRATVHHVTKAEGFHFATDSRIKDHTMETRLDMKQKDFTSTLRSQTDCVPDTARNGPTIPQPFKLAGKKRKRDLSGDSNSEFKSVAQQVAQFSSRTPERFRVSKKDGGKKTEMATGPYQVHVTIPVTPNFETRGRKRQHKIVSQAELDEIEVEELKKYKFKAHPVNKKIFKNPNTGVRKVPKKEPTQPIEMKLETERRVPTRQNNSQEDSFKAYEFRAKPVPSAILKHPVGVGQPKAHQLTVPESPAFVLKNRLRSFTKHVPTPPQESHSSLHVHPVPHVGIPFQPKLDHRVTEPQPFSFEVRDKLKAVEKEEKIKQVYEEEKKKREFTAQLLPIVSPDLPPKVVRSATKVVPFELEVDLRGAKKAEEWTFKLEEELKQQRALANFKAHSSSVLHKAPFVPIKSDKPLTEVLDFELNTESRAERRAEWEQYQKERCDEADRHQEVRQARLEEEQREEAEQLRAETVFKHNEVRHYKPITIQPSDKPLTQPETPKFSARLNPKTLRC
ncbi:hypothetical protein LSAT2_027322 [Lamellibrachia satsuma]|nr:hypothetical protein LSAT2_027322 [Lamellibrachia satsuma]